MRHFDLWTTEREKAIRLKCGLKVLQDEDNGRFYLKVWKPKAINPYMNYYYTTEAARTKSLESAIDSRLDHIEAMSKPKTLSTAAQAAKAIRKELKENFKDVKFSVRSDNFSMGNSVDISWTDGPTTEKVEAIVNKYQYGHFDGMDDCYYNSNNIEGLPQAKFVQTNRHISERFRKHIIDGLLDKYSHLVTQDDIDNDKWIDRFDCYANALIYRNSFIDFY